MGRPEAGYTEPVSKATETTSGPSSTPEKLKDNEEGIY